jgi:hypothetical protein
LVHSVHQSFRDAAGDNGPAALCFPRWPESVLKMRHIQRAAARDVLAVSYPAFRQGKAITYTASTSHADKDPGLVYAPFAVNTFQPKPEHFNVWGLTEDSSTEEIGAAMQQHGLPYVTWDVVHAQGFENPLELCEQLAAAGLIKSVHLSVGRKDEARRNPKIAQTTMQADQAFMASPESAARTLEGEMLVAVATHWKQQPPGLQSEGGYSIVLEKPFRAHARQAQYEDQATFETVRALVASI